MGGKTKQSQRTKNNVRPSSSGRSAELLNNTVRLDPGLMSTSTGKVLPVLFPTLAAPLDPSLNPDFALCLKKLNKKDPITKTKALQELCDLVKKGDVEAVVAALPSWAHYYRILTTDTDHKVREAAQTAHGAVATACGRRLAPALRALLPPWLQAQYDEYAPAATAARASLASTFPASKLPDVISFCMAEVIAHLLENLVGNADVALSKKNLTPEEKELQWVRLVTTSLQGLEFFVQHLPPAHDEWLWTELTPLLQAATFWKMGSHKSQQVKASWFGALGRIIARYGSRFGAAHGPRAACVLLAAPPALAQHWCCLLVLMRHVQDDTWLDKKELLIKRIIDVLENGGWGDAKHLSSMLLPLLAFLPQHMLTKQFYETFFNAVFKGLEKKSVMNSKSERQSWITSLSECLRYLSLQHTEYAVEVATLVHRTWLERALAPGLDMQTTISLVKHSAASMASLVKYWLRQSQEVTEGSEKYDQLARNFWQNVSSTVVAQIDKLSTEQSDITALVEAHILLLRTLKTSQETKKTKSIKFDDENQVEDDNAVESPQPYNASIEDRYKHNLDNVVEKITVQYFEFASKKQVSNTVFSSLLTLLLEFDDKNLFLALARHFDADSVYGLYHKVLRGWLAGDTMRCRAVVDIVFLLMKHLSEEEQETLLDSFKQFPPSVVEWCISLSLSHPHCRLPAVRRWLRGSLVEESLVAVCNRMINEDDSKSRSLLLMCLATDDDGEIMISPSTVSVVMKLVCAALSPTAPALERLAGAAAALASELSGADCTELATALFTLQLAVQRGSGRLRAETWLELRAAWQDAGAGAGAGAARFRRQAVQAAGRERAADTESLDIARIEHVASLCPYLLPQFGDSHVPADTSEVVSLLRQLFDDQDDSLETMEVQVQVFALRHDCIHSRLNCPLGDTAAARAVIAQAGDPRPTEPTKRDLVAYMNKLVFRAALLRTLATHRDEEEVAWAEELFKEEYIEEEFAKVLHDCAVVCSLYDGYAFWAHFEVISAGKQHVSGAAGALAAELGAGARGGLRARLQRRAATEGYYWCLAALALGDDLERGVGTAGERGDTDSSAGLNLADIVTGSGFFHTLQAESRSSSDPLSVLRTKYLVMLRSFYLAHAHEPEVIDPTFIGEAAAGTPADPEVIVNAYYRHQHTMLYDSDISVAEWRQVVSNAAVAEYLAQLVRTVGWELAAAGWDFVTISLCSLATATAAAAAAPLRATDSWSCPKVAMLACSVLGLFLEVQRFVGSVRAECLRREPSPHVAMLPAEWSDIFAPDLHYNLFQMLLQVLGRAAATLTSPQAATLAALLPVARALDWHALPPHHQTGELSVAKLVEASTRALSAPAHPAYKYLAHALLGALARPLVLHDAEQLAAWSQEEAGEDAPAPVPRPPLAVCSLLRALQRLEELVDAALHQLRVGEDTCEMVPGTDSHSLTLGYLLLADATCAICELARGDLVHHYIELFRQARHAEALVACALRLLPAPVAAHAYAHAHDGGAAPAPALYTHMFQVPPVFSLQEPPDVPDVARLACRAVWGLARVAGGALRGWWGAAPPRAARALERVLRAHVSPALVRAQLHEAGAGAARLRDAEVSVHPSTNEVVCTYRVEDRSLELSIALGAAHPLPLPRVTAPRAPQHNTHWLAIYLAYQNGTVLNAIRMWMDTVAKRVEASPQCYICYCRLHPAADRLPKVPCHQCRNKFHTDCLRKWFQTSGKSNCPLCRSNF